jgi:hypothetical protein
LSRTNNQIIQAIAVNIACGGDWKATPAQAKSRAGKSYVIFGKIDSTTINLSAIASGTGGFVINGENANDQSSVSLSNAGDVNGDGMDDLIVGAYGANRSGKENAGKSCVIFGKKDSTAIELSAIASGTGGFVINGENAHDWSGFPVSTAGDINGDGLVETGKPLQSCAFSPLITNPPVPLAIAASSIAVLSFLPKMT